MGSRSRVQENWIPQSFYGSHRPIFSLSVHSTIFCFRVLGLFSSFQFVSNIPRTHHDAQHPPHYFFFFFEFWVCFEHSTHTPWCSTPTRRFFVSEFWVCFKHSTHTPRCSTPIRRFFVAEFWVCYLDWSHQMYYKKKLNFSIPILISDFLRQMRYRWNRHHSYIMNIIFLNTIFSAKINFFIFCIFVFIGDKRLRAR